MQSAHVSRWTPTTLTISSFQDLCSGNVKLVEFLNLIKLHLFFICLHEQSLMAFHSCLCSDNIFGSSKSQEGDADDKKM